MKKTFFIFSILITSCVTLKPENPVDLSQVHIDGTRLAVVSNLYDRIGFANVGMTFNFNRFGKQDVLDWNMAEKANNKITELLNPGLKFDVEIYDNNAASELTKGLASDRHTSIFGFDERKKQAIKAANELGAEILLILNPVSEPFYCAGHTSSVEGFGIHQRVFGRHLPPFFKEEVGAYTTTKFLSLQMTMFDGTTGEPLGHAHSKIEEKKCPKLCTAFGTLTEKQKCKGLLTHGGDKISDDTITELKPLMQDFLDRAVEDLMRQIGLHK